MKSKRETKEPRPENQGPPGEEQKPDEEQKKKQLDELLDKELEDTFPASDPPSLTQDPRED